MMRFLAMENGVDYTTTQSWKQKPNGTSHAQWECFRTPRGDEGDKTKKNRPDCTSRIIAKQTSEVQSCFGMLCNLHVATLYGISCASLTNGATFLCRVFLLNSI